MGIKYKKEKYIEQDSFKQFIGLNLYKRRNIVFFLFLLCTSLFLFSGLFLNQQSLGGGTIYTEGTIVEKVLIDKQEVDIPILEDIGCKITIEFNLRNGKKIQKTIPMEKDFCSYINLKDTLSVLYYYNRWNGTVEIVSYSRFPIQHDNPQREIEDKQAL